MSQKQNYEGHRASPERRHTAQRETKAARKSKPAILAAVIVLIIVVVALVAALLLRNGGDSGKTEDNGTGAVAAGATDQTLTGTWAYGEYTRYDFENDGSGAMRLDDTAYPYTYSTDGDQLYLDFESDAVADATYTYTVSGDTLTLTGGEGTTGGTYELAREN